MEEVEEIADRIIIMDHRTIIAEGTKEELKKNIEDERVYSINIANKEKLTEDDFFKIEGVKKVIISDEKVEIASVNTVENLDKLILTMMNKKCKIQNIDSSLASLERVFLNLTGRSLRE